MARTVKLSPAQFRDTLGISQETLRHWRKSLPVFHGRNGYAPAFTASDLVVGVVIKLLREQWGISVASFAEQSVSLGQAVHKQPWSLLANSVLQLSLVDKSCVLVPCAENRPIESPSLLVPLAPIVEQLTAALLHEADREQVPIYFPPVEVARKSGTS